MPLIYQALINKQLMLKSLFLSALLLLSLSTIAQDLTQTSRISISKTWPQQPNGYTYPIGIKVPTGTAPADGFLVCILLHGNGGNGPAMIGQFQNTLSCHILIAPTGYQNSWNICGESSDAPDIDMIEDLIVNLQAYQNVDPNRIRVIGSSNGAGLANRIFIENKNSGVDIVCSIVSHLNTSQYHSDNFHKPSSITDTFDNFCGYNVAVNPLNSRKYLSISNTNDPLIPYQGGPSVVGVNFLDAEEAAFTIASYKGYAGSKLSSGTDIGNPVVTEFAYSANGVIHLKGDARHGANSTQLEYITEFFSDCIVPTSIIEKRETNEIKAYPNPAKSSITIYRFASKAVEYTIVNSLGEELINDAVETQMLQIDLSELPINIYFLKIDNQTIKIVKH